MARPPSQTRPAAAPAVLTANRLEDGAVVYHTAVGVWSRHLEDAQIVITPAERDTLLAVGQADVAAGRVVGVSLIAVEQNNRGQAVAVGAREAIRAHGPTLTLPVDHPLPRVGAF